MSTHDQKTRLPTVKIIILSKSPKYLDKCWKSIEEQDYPAIIKTSIGLEGCDIKADPRLAVNINKEIKDAHIFSFIESNVELSKTYISEHVSKIIENPTEIGLVYSDYKTDMENIYYPSYNSGQLFKYEMISPNYTLSVKVFQSIGLYNEKLDIGFQHDFIKKAVQKFMFCHIPKILCIKHKEMLPQQKVIKIQKQV